MGSLCLFSSLLMHDTRTRVYSRIFCIAEIVISLMVSCSKIVISLIDWVIFCVGNFPFILVTPVKLAQEWLATFFFYASLRNGFPYANGFPYIISWALLRWLYIPYYLEKTTYRFQKKTTDIFLNKRILFISWTF